MSGPKVVRVISREELLARTLDQIASVESAVAKYAALGRRHDIDLSTGLAEHRTAVAELKSLAQAGAWDAVARTAANTIRVIELERSNLEESIIAAATKDRTIRRRLRDAAKVIQREILSLKLEPPAGLYDVIANADKVDASEFRRMDAIVVAASKMLIQHAAKSKSADESLAKRLGAGLSRESYATWLASNAVKDESQNFTRLDKILAELEYAEFANSEVIKSAIERIHTADEGDRDLLVDSLTIELSELLKTKRQRGLTVVNLESYIPRLENEGSEEARNVLAAIRATIVTGKDNALRELELRADNLLKSSRAKTNAVHQRKAILSGLTALGYEVREGMATALVENGRLVVRKPAELEYGVEIVAGASDGRLQVRMVSFQSNSNPMRDKDVEIIWCGELAQLQSGLSRAGHSLEIEKALAPGAAPMKHSQLPSDYDAHATTSDLKMTRTRTT